MPTRTANAEKEACRYISDLVFDRCGIQLRDNKESLIKARLAKRMRHHSVASLPVYCELLREQNDPEEFTRVVDALTTNFTQFLRESDHFQFLVEKAQTAAQKPGSEPFRVWSAACSSGEEPCSIAMHLAELLSTYPDWDWRITASDISTKVLAAAKLHIYAENRVKDLPRLWLRKYFQKGVGQWQGHYRVKRNLADRIHFEQINLVSDFTHPNLFPVIFLRNVMIYFDRAAQEQMVNRVCRFLAPQGYLLIGHSETLHRLNVPLQCLRPSIYQSTIKQP